MATVSRGQIAWVLGVGWPSDTSATFETLVKRRGAKYVFHLMDDWFSVPAMEPYARSRVEIADLVLAVTPELKNRVSDLYPSAAVEVIEEPIDVDRLGSGRPFGLSELPLVVWNGSTHSLRDLVPIVDTLNHVRRRVPFHLRIVCGNVRPALDFDFEWQWLPYSMSREADALTGATIGLAPLANTAYARCKNTTKVKCYAAAGVAVIGSSIGHNTRTIVDGVTGLLVRQERDWAEALASLISQPDVAVQMGAAAQARAIREYSQDVVGHKWAQLMLRHFPAEAL